ncbi:uncharacterized protein BXZ73DRAFT_99826 [Epithele typhae]|uniref:uncharacterized protein n=1 Tax=Epithele typhae TaxID=378194 RepID=UPI0020079AA4|nr:uncharacterized protein BXZ73DRAFT_99826 [Epithele typhae]KAH9938763.1 hypothetical protein BXZ73DRAFT_99826 [Epithele typhae]
MRCKGSPLVRFAAASRTFQASIDTGRHAASASDVSGEHAKLLGAPVDQTILASIHSRYTHFAWATSPRKQGGLGLKLPPFADHNTSISREDEGIALHAPFIINPGNVVMYVRSGVARVRGSRRIGEQSGINQVAQMKAEVDRCDENLSYLAAGLLPLLQRRDGGDKVRNPVPGPQAVAEW